MIARFMSFCKPGVTYSHHAPLKRSGCIAQSKRHPPICKSCIWASKCGLMLIIRMNRYLEESRVSIKVTVAEPLELSRLKCAGHHHKGNTSSNALQTEQFLVCRVTSRYNYRFSDRTSIPRTKASPEIVQQYILQHKHNSYYKPV